MTDERDKDGKFIIRLDSDEYVLFRNLLDEYKRSKEERSAFWAALRKQSAWAIVVIGAATAWWAFQEWLGQKYGKG